MGKITRDAGAGAGLAAAYFAASMGGLHWAQFAGAGSPVWPAAGVGLAGLLLGGRRLWPAILIGRLAAALVAGSALPLWADTMIAAGNAAGTVVAVQIIRRHARAPGPPDLRRLAPLARFLAAAVAQSVLSAASGTAALCLAAVLPLHQALLVVVMWALGVFVGTVIVAALILAWTARLRGEEGDPAGHWAHFTTILLVTVLLSWIVFHSPINLRTWELLPALVWAALAFHIRGAATALALAAVVAIWGTAAGTGPLAEVEPRQSMVLLQRFLAVTSMTILLLAAAADERRGREALRESETRFRTMAETAPVGIWVSDATGDCVYVNQRWREITGAAGDGWTDRWRESVHPDDRERVARAHGDGVARHGAIQAEYRLRQGDGRWRWVLEAAEPRSDPDGGSGGYIGTLIDINERRVAEEHRKLLIDELNHRVKNMLAVVQSVADQTFRGEATSGTARQAFSGRLEALSSAHDLLTKESWTGATMRDIAWQTVGSRAPDRARLDGPHVPLKPKAAVTMAMALHELYTNALKYGALSVPDGRVDLSWEHSDERFVVVWQERDGPPVQPPARRGFGSRMIERALTYDLDARAAMEFHPAGLRCVIDITLPRREREA